MFQKLLNRTIINYLLVTVGSALFAKIGIPGDLWHMLAPGFEEAIMVALTGGSIGAVILGAARGIIDSNKTKAVVDGKQVPLSAIANNPDIPAAARNEARVVIDKTRSLIDMLTAK